MSMKTWIIEPRDPFIARDGKPFSAIPGTRAASLPFPFPSTMTGGVRTRAGLRNGVFDTSLIGDVKNIDVRGPLLVELDNDGKIIEWLLPAPSDALLLEAEESPGSPVSKDRAVIKRLAPRDGYQDLTNLPAGLLPVFMLVRNPRKPLTNAPRYWKWKEFEDWLLDPKDDEVSLASLGHNGPSNEDRTHVKVEHDSQTAEEGKLFQTRGLEFTHQPTEARLSSATRLAIAIATDATDRLAGKTSGVVEGLSPLGGERRLVCWRESSLLPPTEDLFAMNCPQKIRDAIVADTACRVVLLTPAYFERGCIPTWLLQSRHGCTPQLKAIATGRAQVVSGWDFERVATDPNRKYGRPKPTRRLVPVGAVLFLRLRGTTLAIEDWIESVWMNCVSDDDNLFNLTPRLDGFGLAILGTWREKLNGKEQADGETNTE